MRTILLSLVSILIFLGIASSSFAQKYTVSGYIKDATDGEALIGANVFDLKFSSGTSSNTFGFYSLTLPSDSVSLIYSYVGYQPQTVRLLLTQDTLITIELTESSLLDEVVISAAEAEKIQEVTQMSTISVPIEQIKNLPALLGEVDVLKTLQLLPGVQ
ncbi:MAG: carboxypeptidase-like regulatory domain-containing protein, partial [Tunicatimonas sp.]|uniref:carboxypeptidase-like regulatory domain-containing protein n=1 Tax=Tunicatimonas sp. TaxID=1940096 RepID=UPI003C76A35B